MTQTQKRLLFWLPFAGLLAGGAALWWLVLGPRFPKGNGIHFAAGLLWGWMGLAHLLGFFPQKADCPRKPSATPGRRASSSWPT